MGMPAAFDKATADFNGLAGGVEQLWIDQVYRWPLHLPIVLVSALDRPEYPLRLASRSYLERIEEPIQIARRDTFVLS